MTLLATVVLLPSGLPAPELSGPVETVAAAGFEVHFTREGSDAPPREEAVGTEPPLGHLGAQRDYTAGRRVVSRQFPTSALPHELMLGALRE